MMQLYDKIKKNLFFMVEIILLFLVILPYLYTALYSFPTADDFAGASNMRNAAAGSSYLLGSLKLTKNLYFSWQGSYSGEFIDYYFSPILRLGYSGTHAEAILVIGSFVFLFLLVVWNILKYLQMNFSKELYFFISEMTLIFLLLFQDADEYFYWHTGIAMYTIPILFAFILLLLEFGVLEQYRRWKVIVACICAFIAVGGTLQISAYVCVITLGMILLEYNKGRHINKCLTVIFFCALAGALINVAAPGNYVRHKGVSEEYYIVQAVVDSCRSIISAVYLKLQNGLLIGTLGLWFVLGINYLKKSTYQFKTPGLISLALFLGNVVTTFPVKLGYGVDYFPSRCIFTQNILLTISLLVVVLYWAGWLTNKVRFTFSAENVLCVSLIIIFLFSPLLQKEVLQGAVPVRMYKMWSSGATRNFYEDNLAIIKLIEQTETEEVYIPQGMVPAPIGLIKPLELSADETDWVNDAMAGYYGKSKVVVY